MESTLLSDIRCVAVPWDGALAEPLYTTWQHLLHADSPAQIFDYPEWLAFAGQAGAVTPWKILVIHQGDRPIGLIPLQRQTPWSAGILSHASPGHAPMLIDPATEDAAYAGLAAWFAKERRLPMLRLDSIADERRLWKLHQACQAQGLYVRQRPMPPMMRLELPDSWEAFHAQLGYATRKSTKKVERRLLHDVPGLRWQMLTEYNAESERVFEEMIRVYRVHWGQQAGGCFYDDPRNVASYRQSIRWALEQGYAALSVLTLDEQVIVALSLFRLPHQTVSHFHIVARDMETLSGYYSPGMFLMLQTIRWEIARGTTCIDIGAGKNEYKVLLGGQENPAWEIAITRSPAMRVLVPAMERGLHITRRLPVHLHYQLRRMSATVKSRVGAKSRALNANKVGDLNDLGQPGQGL